MAKRERPGQVRVHRGFLKAEGVEVLWPEGVLVGEFDDRFKEPPSD